MPDNYYLAFPSISGWQYKTGTYVGQKSKVILWCCHSKSNHNVHMERFDISLFVSQAAFSFKISLFFLFQKSLLFQKLGVKLISLFTGWSNFSPAFLERCGSVEYIVIPPCFFPKLIVLFSILIIWPSEVYIGQWLSLWPI